MSAPPTLQPAPGRGQYDRRQSREARLSEQRSRLLSATALSLLSDPSPSVATVVKHAGVSRNTFYEYFDDLEHARSAAAARGRQRLEQLLRQAELQTRTPVERWRALVHAWLDWVLREPAEAHLCLNDLTKGLSSAGRELESALVRSASTLRASGVVSAAPDALRVTAVAAACEAFARRFVADRSRFDDGTRLEVERQRLERTLVDVAVRVLR